MCYRDSEGNQQFYEPIALIEYTGNMENFGEFRGHYKCYIRHFSSKDWYLTNDSDDPVMINTTDVSRYGYVVLFHRS